jgi:hypothetical protein
MVYVLRCRNPALFWAAHDFGFYELKMAAWQMAKLRWSLILAEKREKADTLPPVPEVRLALTDAGVARLKEMLMAKEEPGERDEGSWPVFPDGGNCKEEAGLNVVCLGGKDDDGYQDGQ